MPSPKKKPDKKMLRRQAAVDALGEFRPKGLERWGMFLIGCAVACYIAFVICSKIFLLLPLTEGLPVYLLFPVLAPGIYWLMCFALQYFQDKPSVKKKKKKKETPRQAALRRLKELCPVIQASRTKLSPAVFFSAFLGVFAVMLLSLFAQYPGGFIHPDNGWQWNQVQASVFDSWHPPIHTMLIWLVTRIVNSYGFFIGVQVFFFSLMVGYMASALRAWGIQTLWVALFALAVVSAHSTRAGLLYAVKDSMFACFALWMMVCLVNIVLSRGEWLGKWGNRIALAVVLAFVTLIRLNGFFFTIPVIVLIFLLYGKKQAIAGAFSGALAVLIVLGVRGPLYRAVGVKNVAGQTYEEISTPPMNILTSIYKVKPGALDEDGVRLMQWLATPEQWAAEKNRFGDYSVLKGLKTAMIPNLRHLSTEAIADMEQKYAEYRAVCPPDKLVSMLWHAVKNEPTVAMKAFVVETNVLWDPIANYIVDISPDDIWFIQMLDDETFEKAMEDSFISAQLWEDIRVETRKPYFRTFQRFQGAYQVADWMFHHLTLGGVLQNIGVNMLAIMLCMWFSLRRRWGWETLLLALPYLSNNLFCFCALICPDYRWLYYNVVITGPLVLVCLAKAKKDVN